jgi:hypothetical protein
MIVACPLIDADMNNRMNLRRVVLVRQLTTTEQAQLVARLSLLQFSNDTAKGLTTDSKPENALNKLQRLGKKIAQGWPSGVSSADVLAKMRR